MENKNILKAKDLMEQGWKTREELKFDEAENLLNQAKDIFEEEGDWFNVSECINHLAILEKLKAVHHNLIGMRYAQEADKIARENETERKLVLRALMSLANSSGLFEQALKWGIEALPLFTKDTDRADILAHIATFQLRTGDTSKALTTIKEAEFLMEKGYEEQGEPHRSIWKSKILLTKALILFNNGELSDAKTCFNEGYSIAKDQKLKTRLAEAEALKPLFDDISL